MHLLALTAGAALASIAPATAPPGAPPAGAVPAGTYTLEDSFAGAPFTVTLTVPEGWTLRARIQRPLGVRRHGVHHPGMFTEVRVASRTDEPGSRRQLRLEGERRDHGRDGRRAGGGDGRAARLVGQRSRNPCRSAPYTRGRVHRRADPRRPTATTATRWFHGRQPGRVVVPR